jgi:hypothetical protein
MKVRIEAEIEQDVLDGIENWRRKQGAIPSRRETIRFLIEAGLKAEAAATGAVQ